MKIKLKYVIIIISVIIVISLFMIFFIKKPLENTQINNGDCFFIPTTLQPSTYFGGELENHFESSNGLMNIKYNKFNNRDVLTIYSKPGDRFELWEIYGNSMKPASGETFIGLNLLNFSEKDLEIGDVIFVKKVDEVYPNGTIVSQKLIRHRIIDIQNVNGITYYQTKGDNNKFPDKSGLTDNQLWRFQDIYAKEIGGFY